MPCFAASLFRAIGACVALVLLSFGATAAAALPESLAVELRKVRIDDSSVALWVQRIGEATPWLSHQPDQPMNPASVMKLVTSFAAFDVLGPDHAWKTRVLADAPAQDGVLAGNLYIVGEGDPALTLERLWRLLRGLRQQGVEEIRGNLVLDRSAWPLPAFDPAAFDGRGARPYNTGPDALLVNFAALKLTLVPSPGGGGPELRSDPPLEGISVVSALVNGRGACGEWDERLGVEYLRLGDRGVLRVLGEWRDSCGARDWYVAPLPPAEYSRAVIAGMWRELGGRLRGTTLDGTTPAGVPLLAVEVSPPLAEVVREMNKWSNNVQARHLLATLGAAAGGHPDVVSAGARVPGERLAAAGIDARSLVVENGSGLSRIEAISARALGQMLVEVFRRPWMPEFVASMALAGVDGTARRRLAASPVRGQAHVKTGYLNGVRSIAGYVLDRHGARHAFAMLVNDPQAWASREAQDALLEWIWQAPPGAAK